NTEPDSAREGMAARIPSDKESWISAWPISRIVTPCSARIALMFEVNPGLYAPVTRINTNSVTDKFLRFPGKSFRTWLRQLWPRPQLHASLRSALRFRAQTVPEHGPSSSGTDLFPVVAVCLAVTVSRRSW